MEDAELSRTSESCAASGEGSEPMSEERDRLEQLALHLQRCAARDPIRQEDCDKDVAAIRAVLSALEKAEADAQMSRFYGHQAEERAEAAEARVKELELGSLRTGGRRGRGKAVVGGGSLAAEEAPGTGRGGEAVSTRYVFRRVTTVTVTMADPGEMDAEGEPGPATAEERDESAREWAEQALPLDDYAEPFVEVEHGPIELIDKRAGEPAEEPGK